MGLTHEPAFLFGPVLTGMPKSASARPFLVEVNLTLRRPDPPHPACNSVQGATALLASTATLAMWTL